MTIILSILILSGTSQLPLPMSVPFSQDLKFLWSPSSGCCSVSCVVRVSSLPIFSVKLFYRVHPKPKLALTVHGEESREQRTSPSLLILPTNLVRLRSTMFLSMSGLWVFFFFKMNLPWMWTAPSGGRVLDRLKGGNQPVAGPPPSQLPWCEQALDSAAVLCCGEQRPLRLSGSTNPSQVASTRHAVTATKSPA